MLTITEINPHNYILSSEQQANISLLLERVNIIRSAWGKPMTVTSGFRSMADHLRIYAAKGVPLDKIPMHSKHLAAAAVDISDPNLSITKWLKSNPQLLEQANLWCEEGNKNWVHFQCIPFGSWKAGKSRWFLP